VAESLGRATFDVLLDTTAFRAGIEQVRGLATRAGKSIEDALGSKASRGSLASLDIRITSLKEEIRLVEIGSAKYKQLQRDIRNASKERAKAEAGSDGGFGPALGSGLANLGAAAGIGIGFAGIAAGVKQAVQAAVEFESITRKLQNTLGPQGAAGALQFTKGLSDQLGLSFKQLSNDFGSFTAASSAAGIPLQQQQAVFEAVAKAGQALGLSGDAVSGSLLALQQIASKGVVSMEELRQQLGERLPIAFSAAAQGLGVTQQELNKLVESGQLTAQEFFPALAKGLNQLTAGAGGVETSAQQFQKLGNAWEELQVAFGDSLVPTIIEQVKTLTGALKGIGIVISANKLGLGGGLIGNALGIIPEQGTQAVVALEQLQQQFNLTGKQARALFTDAVKLEGINNIAFAAPKEFEQVLARLPGLAEEFRKKYKDGTGQLQAANAAAAQSLAQQLKAQAALRTEQIAGLSVERTALQQQEARLGFYSQEYQLVGQINSVRAQGAIARSDTIKSLLDQELAQAQKLAVTDGERRQLELQYGQAKFNQTVAEFDLKAKALVTEQASQRASLAFEQQKAAAAGKRAEIEAQIALLQAQAANADKGTAETQRQVELAKENLELIRQQNGQEQALGGLRSQLLDEQQAAARQQLEQQRLLALNGQAENGTLDQQLQLQADVNQELKNRAGYADAAAVSASNFRQQLQGASEARGDLSTAFQAQVNTVIDGSQQFSQMNTFLSQIATNTSKPPTVNVTVNNSAAGRGNSSAAVVSGTSR
jgi:tape measure domain-containing protein